MRRARRSTPGLVVVALALAGCASAGEQDASPGRSETPAVLEVGVAVAGGEVTPPPHRMDVDRGATVRLSVTSDRVDEVHVHGFGDPEVALEPGVPAVLDLVADETGQFEIETHEGGLLLLTIAVR